jgi:hypothetical protein
MNADLDHGRSIRPRTASKNDDNHAFRDSIFTELIVVARSNGL